MSQDDDRFEPDDMQVELNKGLTITWADGVTHFLPSRYLRLRSPCAQWREYTKGRSPEQLEIITQTVPEDLQIADAREMGNYALGFIFSDGHKTGIYEFSYLRELGEELEAGEALAAELNDELENSQTDELENSQDD